MSHFSFLVEGSGPLLTVLVGLSVPRVQALTNAGQIVPSPIIARMLVDTGASMTSIGPKFVSELGLVPTGSISMHTPSTGATPHVVATYDVALYFSGHEGAMHSIQVQSVMECDLGSQGIDGLIGRDILSKASLTYFGPGSICYLSF